MAPPETRESGSLVAGTAPDGAHVLIVDDELAVLQVLTDMLESQGFSVTAFRSPIEALQKAKRQRFDALILDLYMPEMSGLLFHAKLKLLNPELAERTVFVSGYVSREELRSHLMSSAYYLEKPFKAQDLHVCIHKVLASTPKR